MRLFIAHSQPLFANALGKALMRMPGVEVTPRFETQGMEAVETVLEGSPDIALLDHWLSGMGGVAATRRILQARPTQKVVMLCWLCTPHDLAEALDAGAHAVIHEVATVDQMMAVLTRVHAGDRMSYGPAGGQAAPEAPAQADAALWERLNKLTAREIEILRLLASGRSVNEVAAQTDTTLKTMRTHINNILAKTDTRSQTQAVSLAVRSGLLQPGEIPPAAGP